MYNACVLSTLLYGSRCWTSYAAQERELNIFHMHSLRKLLGICWMSRTSNTVVLSRCGLPTMFTVLCQRRLRWLGHVIWMNDGRIPKDILYRELIAGKRNLGRPQLWDFYRHVWIKFESKCVQAGHGGTEYWPERTCHWPLQVEKLSANNVTWQIKLLTTLWKMIPNHNNSWLKEANY